MKSINVSPVEELEIVFGDDKYICTFNMIAITYIQEELKQFKGNFADITVGQMLPLIVYGGIKANDSSFTMDDARRIASSMGIEHGKLIIDMYRDSMPIAKEESKKKKTSIVKN